MIGFSVNKRGRYKCQFCDHTTYKTIAGIQAHLDERHLAELQLARKDAEIERLKNQKPKVEIREKIVYRDAPKPQEKKKEFWYGPAGIYCSTCKTVMTRPGIPVGQTIENTPCHCGNRTLMLVSSIN